MKNAYWEDVVRNLIENAVNLVVNNGPKEKIEESRSIAEKVVNLLDLDEHFLDQIADDIEYAYTLIAMRPTVKFDSRGETGNIFWIMGACRQALLKVHHIADANIIIEEVPKCGSYEDALVLIRKYVNLEDIQGEK